MTNELIPVFNGSIANDSTLLVNARDLHKFLGVGKVFAAWVTTRIQEYGFVENQDFILLSHSGKQTSGRGGHNRKDYHLTLDTAKELAMVERNEKGREIRRYFIQCEKQLMKQSQQHPQPRQNIEPLDGNDMANLKRLIMMMTSRFKYQEAWNHGIWFALRRATGAPSPHPFSVEDIPVLAQECRRIMDVTSATSNLICQFEKDVLKHVIRNRKDFESIAEKMQSDFQQLQISQEGMRNLERFEEIGLMRLQSRAC